MKRSTFPCIFIVAFLFGMTANLVHPVTPTLITERGLDSSMFGVALAAMMVCMFLFSPFWGKLCSYVPSKRVFLICSIGYAVGQFFFCLAQTEPLVVAGRMFSGIFTGGCYTAMSNQVVNRSRADEKRLIQEGSPQKDGSPLTSLKGVGSGKSTAGALVSRNLTVMETLNSVAAACGYFVGGMLGLISVEAAFYTQVVLLVICGILLFAFCEDDMPYKTVPRTKLSLKEANPFSAMFAARKFMTPLLALIFVIVAVTAIGQNSYEQCFNYFIKDQFGMSSAYNGTFKAIIALLTLAINGFAATYLLKKTDVNRIFIYAILASALLSLSVLLYTNQVFFIAIYIVYSSVNVLRIPLLKSMAAQHAKPEDSNSVMGFYQSMNSLGGIFGALFAGIIYAANPYLPFGLACGAFFVALLFSIFYIGKYKKK